MTEIEIVKITNNRFNRATTQNRNSILFHVKLHVEGNEAEFYEYGINRILQNTVSLRCAKNQSCKARLSAKHKLPPFRRKIINQKKCFDSRSANLSACTAR